MRKLALFFVFSLTLISAYAGKYGYYKTYEDFKNGNLVEYAKNEIWIDGYGDKVALILGPKGNKTEVYLKDIYAYLMDGVMYRPVTIGASRGARPITVGQYILYTTKGPEPGFDRNNPPVTFISKAMDTKMYYVGDFYKNLDKIAATDPDFVQLNNGIKNFKGAYIAYRIAQYIMAAPGYVEDVNKIMPPNIK